MSPYLLQACIQYGIGDLVANFVRMALIDGLGGEEEIPLGRRADGSHSESYSEGPKELILLIRVVFLGDEVVWLFVLEFVCFRVVVSCCCVLEKICYRCWDRVETELKN